MKKLWFRVWEDKFYLVSILILIILFQIKLPFYVNAPGGVININDRITYSGKKDWNGSLNMLYVTEYVASVPIYLLSYIIPDWDLESIEVNQVSDNESVEDINIRNKVMLSNSINNAYIVALDKAGVGYSISNQKYIVVANTLKNDFSIGDEVLEVEGKSVDSLEMIREIISKKEVGDKILVRVKRNKKIKDIEATVFEEDKKKALGVVILKDYSIDTNSDISLQFKSSESGASGGLMMALSIYLSVSGEDLLKGRNVAGTGTIDQDGNVGEIGGIKYKVMGAYRNHMDVILVPSANYKEAMEVKKKKGYDIEIVEVKTFDDAINYLKNH